MQKFVWRLKLEADFSAGSATEIEVARIERAAWADPETLELSLSEGKRLTAAIQTEMVRAQASIMGERFRGFVTLFGACDLSVLPVAIDHGKDKLQRLPISARDHPAGDLAVSSVHPELPRRGRFVGGTRGRGLLCARETMGQSFWTHARGRSSQT